MVKLEYLINRGDAISITNGKLNITPKSGEAVPSDWINEHADSLVSQISQVVQQPIYAYTNFTVGGYEGGRFDGITLRFYELTTHADYYTIFNVSLNRRKQPGRLKGKKFIAPKQGALMKFWNRLAMPKPRRPSELYKKINVMCEYFWQATLRDKNKLEGNELSFANVTHQQIIVGLKQGNSMASGWQRSGSLVALNGSSLRGQQVVAHSSGSKNELAQIHQRVQASQTTREVECESFEPRTTKTTSVSNYDISKQGSAVVSNPITPYLEQCKVKGPSRAPQDKTHEEWWIDYDNAK